MTGDSRRLICSANLHLSSCGHFGLLGSDSSWAETGPHLVEHSDANGLVTVPATLVLGAVSLGLSTGVGVPAGEEVVHDVVEGTAAVHGFTVTIDQTGGLG